MKRATLKQAIAHIKEKMKDIDNLGTYHARAILDNVLPFTWHCYCKEHRLNPNILMDKHEKRIRKSRRIK